MRRKKSIVTWDPGSGVRLLAPRRAPAIRSARRTPEPLPAADVAPLERSVELSVDLAPARPGRLLLRAPVLIAAGCLGYGIEAEGQLDPARIGAIITRGTTLGARAGAPSPRMTEAAAGLIHALGLPNPGIEAVLERHAARWVTWDLPVILNVAATTADGFAALAARADEVPGIAALELDLASPDLMRGGRPLSLDALATGRATAAARGATELPLLVKLSAAAPDIRAVARAAVEAGADALTCVGGIPSRAIDPGSGRDRLGSSVVTLSGPAIRPLALRAVAEAAGAVSVPIVGSGGITGIEDALEFLAAGATAVAIGTAALADPGVASRIVDGLAAHCARLRLDGYAALIGTAAEISRRRRTGTPREARPR